METPHSAEAAADRRSSAAVTALIGLVVVAVAVIFVFHTNVFTSRWYALFKVVHVAGAVFWVGGGLTLTVLALRAERQSDPGEMAMIARQAAFVGERFFAPAGLVAFLMGIAMMINTNWGWGHFWITAGLVGFASSFVTGIAVLAPRSKRLHELMQTAGPTAPETQAAIKSILLIARFDMAVLALVVVDMVVKPFSS